MYERKRRSIVKAMSWRATGTIDTFIISFLVTGKFQFALTISGIEVITKFILYFVHERLWNKIKFGKEKAVIDYQI